MKYEVHHQDRRGTVDPPVPPTELQQQPTEELTALQKDILDCLGSSRRAMTLRELEGAVRCDRDQLQQALEGLRSLSLVARLNTVIPSYASRYPGVRIYGE